MLHHATTLAALDVSLSVLIRPATADDLPRLEWDGQMWGFREVFRRTYRDSLSGDRLMLVADAGGYPVGRLFVQLCAGDLCYADGVTRGYLYSLNVLEPYRRRGIGTRLIRASEAALIERGYQWATIAVAVDNTHAQRLYRQLGYTAFRKNDSHWFYTDPDGRQHEVKETCWALRKPLVQWAG